MDYLTELLDGLRMEAGAVPKAEGSWETVEQTLSKWAETHAGEIAAQGVRNFTAVGTENLWETVLFRACGDNQDWMEDYGLPVTEEERKLSSYLFGLEPELLERIGVHIAEAFLHGFISQNRDRRGRRHVRLFYCVGQEALAGAVARALKERGLIPVVGRPQCLKRSGSWAMNHDRDYAVLLSESALEQLEKCWAEEYRKADDILSDTCGMIGIGQFGEPAGIPNPLPDAYQPSSERSDRLNRLRRYQRALDAEKLKPSEISFCKVAFPNLLAGAPFDPIFRAFARLNTMESQRYEDIQQIIIDALDTCERVTLKGVPGNCTNLSIGLYPLADPKKQTLFLNCGGDLNVPHGELFTTPRLRGTEGSLHVGEVYLGGVFYSDLMLTFQDGMVTEYSCGGFSDPEEGREYVRRNLLRNHCTITMGEFAIGSNTLAYATVKRMDLMPRMPILLAEKMGPHIAIGDPCFARGEDAPVYNLADGKEMIARENERTAQRENGDDVYYNIHTDITLAFDELDTLIGHRKDGTEVPILQRGRFVLPGTELLNEPLKGAM